jgi:hypothetical protein
MAALCPGREPVVAGQHLNAVGAVAPGSGRAGEVGAAADGSAQAADVGGPLRGELVQPAPAVLIDEQLVLEEHRVVVVGPGGDDLVGEDWAEQVVEHVAPVDGAVAQEFAHGLPAVEVVGGLQDRDVGDQGVGGELELAVRLPDT